jgi:ferredoxin
MYYIMDTMSMAEDKTETITLRVTPELRARLTEWRRQQADLPDESKAIRRIIELATQPHNPSSCEQCGEPLKAKRLDAAFCSNACRQAAYRKAERKKR